MNTPLKSFLFGLLTFLISFNSSANAKVMNSEDPYESFNRSAFNLTMKFNHYIGLPVANSYNTYVPDPAKTGLSNFFSNLTEPLNMINAFLQGKPKEGLSTFMRFTINSTFGLFGLLDIATPAKLPQQKEDLGQTLAVWGVWNDASFIMIPLLGPSTTRGIVGGTLDSTYNPVYPYIIKTDTQGRAELYLGSKFVDYVKIANLTKQMEQQPDPYIFMRESYLQYRTNLIYDGQPPQPNLDDFDFDAE